MNAALDDYKWQIESLNRARDSGLPYADLNDPTKLPPVGCNLIIKVGDQQIKVARTSHVTDKYGSLLEYRTADTGELIVGRFWWSYP